mmetsp:Transcript_30139/g.73434  ORF Transcript_30139/g.73434 Transcript_30139/m.73434 type:complete len:238 (-) Transcript_30139:84-797(-)
MSSAASVDAVSGGFSLYCGLLFCGVTSSVRVAPGCTVVTRMRVSAVSVRSACVMASTAHLVLQYTPPCGNTFLPASLLIMMMSPAPRSRMPGSTAATPCSTPLTFTSIMRDHAATSQSVMGPSVITPLFSTTASSGLPAHFSPAATAAFIASASVTSHCTATACASPPTAATSASSFSLRRAHATTRAPFATSSRTVASPMPADAPVTSTTRPSSDAGVAVVVVVVVAAALAAMVFT